MGAGLPPVPIPLEKKEGTVGGEFRTWPINRFITMIDDDAALTFDLGGQALSLLPADVPKVRDACMEWLADRE